MFKKPNRIVQAGIIFCGLFFTNCRKEKSNSIELAQNQKIQNKSMGEIPANQEQLDAYSKRFEISKKQSESLIERESQLIIKLKNLAIDGVNGPEMVAELDGYCTSIRQLLSNGSNSINTNRIARLSTEFLKDAPKGQPSREFIDQLDSLKLDNIPDEYDFEIRAIMSIINSISRSRPDLLPHFLVQQAAIYPPTRLDSIVYSTVLETAIENKITIQKIGVTGFELLRDAPNPVYRLLAIKIMAELEQRAENLIGFYASYITEQDPLILGIVVQNLLKINTPEATSIISEIQNSEVIKSQPEVETAINEMVRRHTRK